VLVVFDVFVVSEQDFVNRTVMACQIGNEMVVVAAFAGIAVGSGAAHSDNATAYLRSVNPYAQLSGVR
jgi:hypothetical protein